MGLNASKRVENSLTHSPTFSGAVESVYNAHLSQAQHAFPGLRRYQLSSAARDLHAALLLSHPLIRRWAPSPPSNTAVHAALHHVGDDLETLGLVEFREFAVELMKEIVLDGAKTAVVKGLGVGVVGIAGVGAAARAGMVVVGKVLGVYAVGLVATVYLSLG